MNSKTRVMISEMVVNTGVVEEGKSASQICEPKSYCKYSEACADWPCDVKTSDCSPSGKVLFNDLCGRHERIRCWGRVPLWARVQSLWPSTRLPVSLLTGKHWRAACVSPGFLPSLHLKQMPWVQISWIGGKFRRSQGHLSGEQHFQGADLVRRHWYICERSETFAVMNQTWTWCPPDQLCVCFTAWVTCN